MNVVTKKYLTERELEERYWWWRSFRLPRIAPIKGSMARSPVDKKSPLSVLAKYCKPVQIAIFTDMARKNACARAAFIYEIQARNVNRDGHFPPRWALGKSFDKLSLKQVIALGKKYPNNFSSKRFRGFTSPQNTPLTVIQLRKCPFLSNLHGNGELDPRGKSRIEVMADIERRYYYSLSYEESGKRRIPEAVSSFPSNRQFRLKLATFLDSEMLRLKMKWDKTSQNVKVGRSSKALPWHVLEDADRMVNGIPLGRNEDNRKQNVRRRLNQYRRVKK